ncbi:MAG: HAMP domain-containing sensor histidine kinase [Bacteroidales bacterium]
MKSQDKTTMEELQHLVKELQERNAKLTDDLQQVNAKLADSESLKSHFVSNITNEIINPFTSIMGLSKSILAVKKEDWKRVITMVAMIHSEAFNLDFQLRNIFVAAKIEAGEIQAEISQVDIVQLIRNAMEQFQLEAKKRDVKLVHENYLVPNSGNRYFFNGDAEKIKLILSNLLSNAVKFSFEGSQVQIRTEEEDGELLLVVRDFGTGISEANQKIIFDRFKRLDSGINSINRGHGLGLSITKALLDIMDGTIKIDSEKNNGASFEIRLARAPEETGHTAMSGSEFLFDELDSGEIF